MAGAIKEITVARGHDVRDFALLVFGGGGPIFGAELARQLGIRTVVVPPQPGNFSAVGMLLAQARIDIARTLVADLSAEGMAALARVREDLEREAREAAAREFGSEEATLHWQADMRYRGQRHNVTVGFDGGLSPDRLLAAFEAAYARRFGRVLGQDFTPEVVGLRVIAQGHAPRPSLAALAVLPGATAQGQRHETRRLHVRSLGWVDAPVFRREDLPEGFAVTGPAIVEEYSSTLLIGAGDRAVVGALGEIAISIGQD